MDEERGLITEAEYGRERSVLQKIREKELELSVKIDNTRRDADHLIEKAKQEATELTRKFIREAEIAAAEEKTRNLEATGREVERLRSLSSQEAQAVREQGEKNLERAIEKIVKVVSLD